MKPARQRNGQLKDKGKLVVTYKERLAREMEKWMETKAKIKAIDASDWKREGSQLHGVSNCTGWWELGVGAR